MRSGHYILLFMLQDVLPIIKVIFRQDLFSIHQKASVITIADMHAANDILDQRCEMIASQKEQD